MRRVLVPWGPGGQLAVSGTGLLLSGNGCVTYISAWETTGTAAASVALYDGTSANGQLVTEYLLSSGQSTSEEWGPHWLPLEEGLYVDTLTGSVAGSVTVLADHLCVRWLEEEHHYYRALDRALRAAGIGG